MKIAKGMLTVNGVVVPFESLTVSIEPSLPRYYYSVQVGGMIFIGGSFDAVGFLEEAEADNLFQSVLDIGQTP